MSKLLKLKIDRNTFRKNHETFNVRILTTLIGELENLEKTKSNFNDDDVDKVIKKFIKNINELLNKNVGDSTLLKYEKAFLLKYLPTQISEEELKKLVTNFNTLKDFMIYLNKNHKNSFDSDDAIKVFNLKGSVDV